MQKLLFIMSKGFEKSGGAARAFQFAAMAAEQGHAVEVFLIDDATHWAQFGMAEGIHTSTGEHMKELIDKLVALKAPIYVCKACLNRRMISPDELIEGSHVSTSGDLVQKMADPDFKVITM
jgi:sulfur relay (sulfurtransferase) complex TusBCD TusD component (DsrE family)